MTRRFLSCQAGEFFLASAPSGTGGRAGSRFPATFFPLFQICARKGQPTGRKKGVQYMNQLIQSKSFTTFIVLALTLTCLGLLPNAQAVVPPPDGGYAGSNTAEGTDALLSLSSGIWNTALGFQALNHDTAGNQNTATGVRALTSDTNGGFNTATGVYSLFSNTSGFFNSATGAYSLANNIDGSNNTANGYAALYRNTADNNTATGFAALYHNTTGHDNAAFGNGALANNTIGYASVAAGRNALFNNTEGTQNVANGAGALFGNTTGIFNIALGWGAGSNLTTGDNNIDIFSNGVAGDDSTIRIGIAGLHTATYIAGISGVTVAGGIPVIVDAGGHLGTIVSSQRFKDQIKPMDEASEAILALKPVTFRYKQELDPKGIPQFGLVAEQVEKVNPDLVARDEQGKPYTVRYEAVNAMLLNEFLKEHCKVEKLEATVMQQQKDFHA